MLLIQASNDTGTLRRSILTKPIRKICEKALLAAYDLLTSFGVEGTGSAVEAGAGGVPS